jgi:hypothetical protein
LAQRFRVDIEPHLTEAGGVPHSSQLFWMLEKHEGAYDRIRCSTQLQKGQDTHWINYISFNYKQTLETMKKEPGSSAASYAVDAQILSSLLVYIGSSILASFDCTVV